MKNLFGSRNLRFWLGPFLLGAGFLGVMLADCSPEAPPGKTGLPVGRRAPDFTLPDQNGQPRSLADLLKRGPLALVFYRSADW